MTMTCDFDQFCSANLLGFSMRKKFRKLQGLGMRMSRQAPDHGPFLALTGTTWEKPISHALR